MTTDRDLANNEGNCEMSGSGGENGDVGNDDGGERVLMSISQGDLGDEDALALGRSEGCSQGERSAQL